MMMYRIWDLILKSKKYIWHQLHILNGMVVDLINPPHEWRFLSSGYPRKFVKKTILFQSCIREALTQIPDYKITMQFLFFFFLH